MSVWRTRGVYRFSVIMQFFVRCNRFFHIGYNIFMCNRLKMMKKTSFSTEKREVIFDNAFSSRVNIYFQLMRAELLPSKTGSDPTKPGNILVGYISSI